MKVDKRVIIGVGILAIAIAVVFIAGTNKSQEQEASPTVQTEETIQGNEKKQEEIRVVDVSSIEIPENAANIKGLSEELDNISIEAGIETISSNNIETIASSVGLIGEVDETLNINRYQLADILYNIMYECNKLPDIYGYQLSYKDAKKIPTKYVQPVCYITYLELYTQDENYSGYNWITEDELKESMSKLRVYLENYVETEAGLNTNEKELGEREALKREAEEILKNRNTVDRLNGQSVAIFKNPRTLNELEANINNITRVTKSDLCKEIIPNIEYVNIDEAILDYKLIDEQISGITYLKEDMKFSYTEVEDGLNIIKCNLLSDITSKGLAGASKVVGIKDNKVICEGSIYNSIDTGEWETGIIIDTKPSELDSIGIIIQKSTIENVYTINNEESSIIIVIDMVGR